MRPSSRRFPIAPDSSSPRCPMTRTLLLIAVLATPSLSPAGGSWAFAPGAYTHNPQTGQRVAQYARPAPVEGLPDPRQTVSRYWRTQTVLPGVAGSRDTIYEVRSFGNTLGGFDAQRERGFDAQLQTLGALTPFRANPYLFFGGMQGFGYGTPGYPAALPGAPVPAQNPGQQPQVVHPHANAPTNTAPCTGPGCQPAAAVTPAPGQPGTAWPYAPPTGFVAPPFPFGFGYPGFGYPGFGYPGVGHPGMGHPGAGRPGVGPPGAGAVAPWWGYGPGRQGYVPGGGAVRGW